MRARASCTLHCWTLSLQALHVLCATLRVASFNSTVFTMWNRSIGLKPAWSRKGVSCGRPREKAAAAAEDADVRLERRRTYVQKDLLTTRSS